MARLGNALRITFTGARLEKSGGLLSFTRKSQDQSVWLDWRAETQRRTGAEWTQEIVAEGQITGTEVRWWAGWFANAARVRSFPAKLGDVPSEPVARLWTPLAGQAVEFFVWPEPLGGLALLALFTPDEGQAERRTSVETTASTEDLAAFGTALEAEYEALKGTL